MFTLRLEIRPGDGTLAFMNGKYMGLGIALSVGVGVALGNDGVGAALGVVFGAALNAGSGRKKRIDSN